jgi:hypothetical protein
LIEQHGGKLSNPSTARSANSSNTVTESSVTTTKVTTEPISEELSKKVISTEINTEGDHVETILNPEDEENRQKRFNDLFANLDIESDMDAKDLHDRDRKFDLEAELTRVRLRERQLVREINMLKIQTGEIDPAKFMKRGALGMISYEDESLHQNNKLLESMSDVKEEQDPIHSIGVKSKVHISNNELPPSILTIMKRMETETSSEFSPYVTKPENENDDSEVWNRNYHVFHSMKIPEREVKVKQSNIPPMMTIRERLLLKAARQRARQNGEPVDEMYNFLDDEWEKNSNVETTSKMNFGTFHGLNKFKIDVGTLSPRVVHSVNYYPGMRDESDAPVNLEFRSEANEEYMAVDESEDIEFITNKRRIRN